MLHIFYRIRYVIVFETVFQLLLNRSFSISVTLVFKQLLTCRDNNNIRVGLNHHEISVPRSVKPNLIG